MDDPIAVVTLELEEGTQEIKVYEGEDIVDVVTIFCQRFGLEQDCQEYLIDQINQQLKREPSPRFGDSFGQNFHPQIMQPSQSKQSEIALTTQASSIDENQNSAQKSYELWQQAINKKNNIPSLLIGPSNTVQWNVPNSARAFNDNKKISINERLYNDGLKQQKTKQERHEISKQQKQKQEQQFSTFKPLISPRSREIAQKISKPENNSTNIGSQLYKKGVELNKKKQQLREKHQELQRQQSPFQPSLGLDTSRNHSTKRSSTPIYEKLFNQAKEDKKKKEQFIENEFSKIYTFKPQTKNSILKIDAQEQQKQVNKLFKEQELRQQQLERKKHEISLQNQPTFKPNIKKDSTFLKVSRRKDNDDQTIAQDLWQFKSKLASKNSFCSSSETRLQSQQSQIPNHNTGADRVFYKLDKDNNGYISKDNLNLSGIDVDTLEIISEALYKIEEENLTIDIQQFNEICYELGLLNKLNKQ